MSTPHPIDCRDQELTVSSLWNFCTTAILKSGKLASIPDQRPQLLLTSGTACENLVGYSSDASIFKKDQLIPVKDLKLLVRDYPVSLHLPLPCRLIALRPTCMAQFKSF